MKQWYEELFSNYADTYESEIYTQGTMDTEKLENDMVLLRYRIFK